MVTQYPLTGGLEHIVGAVAKLLGDRPAGNEPPSKDERRVLRHELRSALDDPHLLPAAFTHSPRLPYTGVGTYRLHRSTDFVLFCTVTAPRCVLPAHDHGSWGLVGLYRGVEEEIRYVRLDTKHNSSVVGLAETHRLVHRPGDIATIMPPAPDIHRLVNLGDENAISIHLFGDDIVSRGFRIYAPAHVPVETGSVAYNAVPEPPA